MSIFLTFLIAITVNLDNFLIGVHLGIRGQKLSPASNGIICSLTGGFTFLFTAAARMITGDFIRYTNIFGGLIMILFGIYSLISELLCRQEDPQVSLVSVKDTCLLGIMLAVNCIPPAFSAGVAGLNPLPMGLFSALFSFLSMYFGSRLGATAFNGRFLSYLAPFSSCLLIAIGVGEWFL